jgi:hypothetical protein
MFRWADLGIEVDLITLISAGIIFLLLILVIVLFAKLSGLKKRMGFFMSGSDGKSLEDAFVRKFENMDFVNAKLAEIDGRLDLIDRNLLITFQRYSIVKYDAFSAGGGQLSFVLCMLTKDDNGFIMNTVHSNSNEGYFCYLKEIKNGSSSLELSEEERQALEQALVQ